MHFIFITFYVNFCVQSYNSLQKKFAMKIVGAVEGFSVTLECFSEANPTSLNYWTKGDGQMIHDSKKYR